MSKSPSIDVAYSTPGWTSLSYTQSIFFPIEMHPKCVGVWHFLLCCNFNKFVGMQDARVTQTWSLAPRLRRKSLRQGIGLLSLQIVRDRVIHDSMMIKAKQE